jgi:hypothetical protein
MEISRIEPKLFQVNVREWPVEAAESRLFTGVDSSGKKVAFKVYPHLSVEQLSNYVEVTNQLARAINGSNRSVPLDIGGKESNYLVQIVPISTLGLVEDPDKPGKDWPCTLSPFIDGPSLFDIDKYFLSRHATSGSQNPLAELSEDLSEMSRKNIAIIPWNVKVLEKDGEKILKITDLCASIKSL